MPAFIFPPLRSGGGFCLLAVTLLVVTALPASGQDAPAPSAKESDRPIPEPIVSVTRHSGTFGGQRVSYTGNTVPWAPLPAMEYDARLI